MFGLLGWDFTRQDDIHPQATPTNLTTSNVAKQSQQTVKMLFADMSSEEKNAFRTALMSELDDSRRAQLLLFIDGRVQTFITVNDKEWIPALPGNAYFKICGGTISEG